jgi:hypothetical protein
MENNENKTQNLSAVFILHYVNTEVSGFLVDSEYIYTKGVEETIKEYYNNEITMDAIQYLVVNIDEGKDMHDYVSLNTTEVFNPNQEASNEFAAYEKLYETAMFQHNKELSKYARTSLTNIHNHLASQGYSFSDIRSLFTQISEDPNEVFEKYNNDKPYMIELFLPDLSECEHDEGNIFITILKSEDSEDLIAQIESVELSEYVETTITNNSNHLEEISENLAKFITKIYASRLNAIKG